MFKLTDLVIILSIATLINILVTVVSALRRRSRYGWYFLLGMLGITLWTFAAMLDYAAVTIPLKVLFAKLEYIGYFSALTFMAAYAVLFAGHEAWLRKPWVRLLLILIPLSNLLLVWTNELHGWIWSGFTPGRLGDNVVIFEHGPAFIWTTVSGYLLMVVIAAGLLQVASTGMGILRRQARLLLLALAIPVAGNLLYLSDAFNIPGVDLSSISFSLAGLLFLIALYGSRFMEIAPIARNTLIDEMADGVLVLDKDGNLVDFNPAAQTILNLRKSDLGSSHQSALAAHPEIVGLLKDYPQARTREVMEGGGRDVFDVILTPLNNADGEMYGQLVVLRNISERKQMEQALRQSEEKFYTAFRHSPDAILISRLRDGRFVDVNDGFTRITGYTRQEALASSSLLLGLWPDLAEREKVVAKLQKDGRVEDQELDIRVKSGRIIHCLYSGEIIQFGGEAHALAVVRDITQRARAEAVVKLRLGLWEYAGAHTSDEVMQKALDEVGDLTGSPLGFCHIVEEDQKTIQLRAWSARTLAESNLALEVSHYPLDRAGVWAECARTRKPVIHNDYASLPDRKGMPEGHVGLQRELVVPILRSDRVVAVFGIGNKPSDYDESDVEIVEYIADLVWAIVDQKRADDQIRRLNFRLEQMAMMDELTGLANRRAFFLRGSDEIRRSRRSGDPLSLLMLDVDRFKQVNDTRGHEAGDKVLKCVAAVLLQNIREVDTLARLGGEEFAILLPDTGAEAAAMLGERLRLAVESMLCPELDDLQVTVSVGVTVCRREDVDLDEILRIADEAMYQAKEQGRNRVIFLETPDP